MSKNVIENVVCYPISDKYCSYVINDGQKHCVTYEEIISILTNICPTLLYKILFFIDRKLPFYIELKNLEIFQLKSDEEDRNAFYQKQIRTYNKQEINKLTINNNTNKIEKNQSFLTKLFNSLNKEKK
jgi:hypothetical protein